MKWPTRRGIAVAAVLGVVFGAAAGLYQRGGGQIVGLGGGANLTGPVVAVGAPPRGAGYITLYEGGEETLVGVTYVPWTEYDEKAGEARPVPLQLDSDAGLELVVGLASREGVVAVLDDPANGCRLRAWRSVPVYAGTWVAGGDIDGDELDEIVVGTANAPRRGGKAYVLDDLDHGLAPVATLQVPWKAYAERCGATRPAVGDLDGDGKVEVVLGLADWDGEGGCLAIFKDLKFSRWVRLPWSDYTRGGGGTWPAVGDLDGEGGGELIVGTGLKGKRWAAVVAGVLGSPRVSWLRAPADPNGGSDPEVRPLCVDLDGDVPSELALTCALAFEPLRIALLDDSKAGYAFLGWRRGYTGPPHAPPVEPVATDPGAPARQVALEAFCSGRKGVDYARNADGTLGELAGILSEASKEPPVARARAFLAENMGIWGLRDLDRDLVLAPELGFTEEDETGTSHVVFQQVVSGVPLDRDRIGVSLDSSGVVTSVGSSIDAVGIGEEIDPTPSLTRERALGAAETALASPLAPDPSTELVAWRGQGKLHLCWRVRAAPKDRFESYELLVDAHGGQVLDTRSLTCFEGPPGENEVWTGVQVRGKTWQNNWVRIDAGLWRTEQIYPAWPVFTVIQQYDLHLQSERGVTPLRRVAPTRCEAEGASNIIHYSELLHFVSGQRNVRAPSMNVPEDSRYRIYVSAMWNLQRTMVHWRFRMNRRSWDDNGTELPLIFLSDQNTSSDGAVWDPVRHVIYIAKADRRQPMVSLDILAHEFGHAVVTGCGNRMFAPGEPSAISEHLGDAFAVFTEFHVESETDNFAKRSRRERRGNIWMIGEEVWTPETCLRSLERPYICIDYGQTHPCHMDERLGRHQPYNQPDNGYMHENNGILNKWLYLWVHGGRNVHPGSIPPHDQVEVTGLIQRFGDTEAGDETCIRIAEWAYLDLVRRLPSNSAPSFDVFRLRMLESIRRVPSALLAPCTAQDARQAAEQAFDAVGLMPHHP